MTEIKTSKARILLVEVPEDAKVFNPSNDVLYRDLPPGSFSFLCLLKDITEGMAKELAEKAITITEDDRYVNYTTKYSLCKTALESFASLLFANNVDGSKNWAILTEQIKN